MKLLFFSSTAKVEDYCDKNSANQLTVAKNQVTVDFVIITDEADIIP